MTVTVTNPHMTPIIRSIKTISGLLPRLRFVLAPSSNHRSSSLLAIFPCLVLIDSTRCSIRLHYSLLRPVIATRFEKLLSWALVVSRTLSCLPDEGKGRGEAFGRALPSPRCRNRTNANLLTPFIREGLLRFLEGWVKFELQIPPSLIGAILWMNSQGRHFRTRGNRASPGLPRDARLRGHDELWL